MQIRIDPECGRIGPFWWINADTSPRLYNIPGIGDFLFVRRGSFGWGQPAQLVFEPCEPFNP